MTGAPKHRSIQLLRRLEDGPRGVYSGAIGFFSLNGAADWSIVIRSIVWHPDHLTYGIGGAVTVGSDPEAEWTETVVKAHTLGAALGVELDQILPVATRPGARTWRWTGKQGVQVVDGTTQNAPLVSVPGIDGELLVADSWRVSQGRTRDRRRHEERFAAAVQAVAGLSASEVTRFLQAVHAAVPESGEWFPRVRLLSSVGGPELVADVRPGPPRMETARVQVLPPGDPRRNPRVKGPDLALAGHLITDSGGEEVLLRDADGHILEAGYSAVVWWQGDELCVPDAALAVLPSVTRQWVMDRARRLGHRVREVSAPLPDLAGCETWLLNAYQGIRLVTAWLDAEIMPGPGLRFAHWRADWLTLD